MCRVAVSTASQTVYSSQLMTIKTQSNEITPTVPTFPMQPISSLPSPSTCFLRSHLHTGTAHCADCTYHHKVTAATF